MSDPLVVLYAILCVVALVYLIRRERRKDAIREQFTDLALKRLTRED